jgi:hypothetical protein
LLYRSQPNPSQTNREAQSCSPPDADETPLRRIPAIIGLTLARKLGHLLRCLAKELFILGKMVCKHAGKALGLA